MGHLTNMNETALHENPKSNAKLIGSWSVIEWWGLTTCTKVHMHGIELMATIQPLLLGSYNGRERLPKNSAATVQWCTFYRSGFVNYNDTWHCLLSLQWSRWSPKHSQFQFRFSKNSAQYNVQYMCYLKGRSCGTYRHGIALASNVYCVGVFNRGIWCHCRTTSAPFLMSVRGLILRAEAQQMLCNAKILGAVEFNACYFNRGLLVTFYILNYRIIWFMYQS